jgi:hypothetical protein
MLRYVVAIVTVAVSLQTWGAISSRVLPWPNVYGLMPLAAVPLSVSKEMPAAETLDGEPVADDVPAYEPKNGSTFAPPADEGQLIAANGDAWPLYAFGRDDDQPRTDGAQTAYFAVNLALGVVAVLVVALIGRHEKVAFRRWSLIGLVGLFVILLTDVTQGIWMHWPAMYIVVLSTDHLVATLLAGGVAILILHLWQDPPRSVTSAAS